MGNATSALTTSFRTERDLLDAFRAVADAHQRTVSQELRWVMSQHVKAHEEQTA